MFGKLFKHDMKSTMRIGLPLLIAALALVIVGIFNSLFASFTQDLSIKMIEWSVDGTINERVAVVLTILVALATMISSFFQSISTMVLSATYIAMVIINLVRFYKNLITDEGYLMFTLPVRPIEILSSKVVNACIWNFAAYIIAMGGALIQTAPMYIRTIALAIIANKEMGLEVNLWSIIEQVFGVSGINPMLLVLMLMLAVAVSLCIVIATPVFMFFTIYLGGVVAKKHKLLAGAGFTILGYEIYSILETIIVFFTITCALLPIFFIEKAPGAEILNYVFVIISIILALSVVVLIAAIAVFFILTKWLMTKKLNLP